MSAYFLLGFLLQADVLVATGPARTTCHRDGNFLAKDIGFSLSGGILATHQVSSAFHCAMECMEHSRCKSYNYQHMQTSTQSHQCELLDGTKATGSLNHRSGYTHYESQKSPCEGIDCKNGGSCVPDCLTGKATCACTLSSGGRYCEIGVPPHVEIPPKSQVVLPDKTAIINCYSTRAETHIWYKDNTVLDTTATERINVFSNGSLQIKVLTDADSGAYHCNVSNANSSDVSMAATIEVLKAPEVTIRLSSLVICQLFKRTMNIDVNSIVSIKWFKDGNEIDIGASGGRLHLNSGGGLYFRIPRPTDSGEYKVQASNALGTAISGPTNVIVKASCPLLSHPTNGVRKGFHCEGSVARFQCNYEYTLVGSENLVCQSDGNWNASAPTCVPESSNSHPVRLSGSSNDNEGRVELYSGGQWGAIGHDGWDITDAVVVCKQLGFPGALRAYRFSEFGAGTGPIYLTNVNCNGNEPELENCSANRDIKYCSHNKTSGVLCQNARLAAGGSYYGRLEVYTGGRWGTVCDDRWDMDDTHVACNQLGFIQGFSFGTGTYGVGSGDIVMDDLECLGRESNLMHCPHVTTSNCAQNEAISIKCNLLRLIGTSSYREGRVEKFENGAWGTVCDDSWDNNDALVVCRQLGFPGFVQAHGAAFFGQGTGEIIYDNVECIGNEANLWSCPMVTTPNCVHSEDAGVVCQAHVRLIGSGKYYEGRVESLKDDGTWGTVCDHLWDMNDAHVVCRMLGFPGAVAAYGQAHFGEGTGPIHWDGLECDATESRIRYCAKNPSGSCNHSNDAGVRCQVFHIAGTGWSHEGRVELYQNDQWGTLCDKEFLAGEAQLLCFQIGRSAYGAYWNYASHGQGNGIIQMSNISCIRTEDSIFDCSYSNDTTACSHTDDIAIRCNRATDFDSSSTTGVIRVFRDNQWARVCANHWDLRDAQVACREMGYSRGAIQANKQIQGSNPYSVIRAGLHCDGAETSLIDCRQEVVGPTCTHLAGVVCQDIQLVGPSYYEGEVQLFKRNLWSWGTICDRSWDIRDANVVCFQLGFEAGAESTYSQGDSSTTSGQFVLSNAYCKGLERNIHDCRTSENISGCSLVNTVWVKCIP